MLLSVALYAAVTGWYLQPSILVDDAAITFRYVERMLAGQGFTYNDHEHVLGTSNPLYTLLLSLLASPGLGVESAARALALALFVACALLTTQLTRLLSGSRVAGIVAGSLLITDDFFRTQALGGMESGLAVVLGLLTVLSVWRGREVAAGIFLGLAVWNKLDAGLLALALTVAWILIRRRLPLRVGGTSIAVVLPWALFAQWYFGSVIPHSFVTKAYVHSTQTQRADHSWVLTFLLANWRACLVLGSAASLGMLPRLADRSRFAVLILLAWFLFHAAAFSFMNLGGHYPWYLTVLVPPTLILTCVVATAMLAKATTIPRTVAAVLVALSLLGLPALRFARISYAALISGNPVTVGEAFDNDRRMAGIFLDQYANPEEVVRSGFGWVAFESRMPFNDSTELNTKRILRGEVYRVNHGVPYASGSNPPPIPPGFIPLAMFDLASDLSPGYSWFTVFGRLTSRVAQQGKRHLRYRLPALPSPEAWSPECGLENVRITEVDLRTRPPSGARFRVANEHQPVHVVFTPAMETSRHSQSTGDAMFEIWSGTTRLYQQRANAAANAPVILPIAGAQDLDRITLAFVTLAAADGVGNADFAIWRGVKVVVGDAFVDLERLRNEKLRSAWTRHNPIGALGSSRSPTTDHPR